MTLGLGLAAAILFLTFWLYRDDLGIGNEHRLLLY